MRAVVMEQFGGPEVLRLRDVEDPVPGAREVLVAVEYAGITFVETQIRAGRGPAASQRPPLPRIPGNGVGGRIVAVGLDADPALVGTNVVTTTGGTGGTGGYAELAVASVEAVLPVPPGVSLADAVALLADGRTAILLHRQAAPLPAEWVLVEAAGGGVGSLLVQLCGASGAAVIGAARGAEKAELVRSFGATAVDYSHTGWAREVLAVTGGRGVDLVFDGVGGRIGTEGMEAVRPGGRASIYGMAAGSLTEPGPGVRLVPDGGIPAAGEIRALAAEALAQAAAGRLRPIIGQTFPLAEAARAHQAIEARATTGKTLLIP